VVLRHELSVLRRQTRRPQLAATDRAFLTASRLLPRSSWRSFFVTPTTWLRWHRRLVARRWTYSGCGGRRPIGGDVRAPVLRLAPENTRWGYQRIVGELRGLVLSVSVTTVMKILRQAGFGPAGERSGPVCLRNSETISSSRATRPDAYARMTAASGQRCFLPSEAPSSSTHHRRSLNAATRAGVRTELARCRRHGLGRLPHVDVDDFDGVVAVAQPVPDGDFRLHVSGGIGGTCAQALASRFCGFPFERPVLPLVRTFARF
jgi:hypothetical protein